MADFKVGVCHGHQVVPWGDKEGLAILQRQMGADILITGHTHEFKVWTQLLGSTRMIGEAEPGKQDAVVAAVAAKNLPKQLCVSCVNSLHSIAHRSGVGLCAAMHDRILSACDTLLPLPHQPPT